MYGHEGKFNVTGSLICLPGGLPCETLGVFRVGLLGLLAPNGTCHLAGPGVVCFAFGKLYASSLPDRMIEWQVVEVMAFDGRCCLPLGTQHHLA